MSTDTQPALSALLSRLNALSGEATSEELAYLANAMSQIGGKSTVLDVALEGAAQVSTIQTEGATQVAAVQVEGTTQANAVVTVGDAKLSEIAAAAATSNVIDGAADVTLPSPPSQAYIVQPTARIAITLPDATGLTRGAYVTRLENDSTFAFDIKDAAGTRRATVMPFQGAEIHLKDNATAAGRWRITVTGIVEVDEIAPPFTKGNPSEGVNYTNHFEVQGPGTLRGLSWIADPLRNRTSGALTVYYNNGNSTMQAGAWPFPSFDELMGAGGEIRGSYSPYNQEWLKNGCGVMPFPYCAMAVGSGTSDYELYVWYDGAMQDDNYRVDTTDNYFCHHGTLNLNDNERLFISVDYPRNEMHVTYVWYDEGPGTLQFATNRFVTARGLFWQCGPRQVAFANNDASYTIFEPDQTDGLVSVGAGTFPAGFKLYGGHNNHMQYGVYLGQDISLAPNGVFKYNASTPALIEMSGFGEGTAVRPAYASYPTEDWDSIDNVWSTMRYWGFSTWTVRPGVAAVIISRDFYSYERFSWDLNDSYNDHDNGFEPGKFMYYGNGYANVLAVYSLGDGRVDVDAQSLACDYMNYSSFVPSIISRDEVGVAIGSTSWDANIFHRGHIHNKTAVVWEG